MKHKRFLCFSYGDFYPEGGTDDIKTSFDDLQSAIAFCKEQHNDFVYIFDCEERRITWDKDNL